MKKIEKLAEQEADKYANRNRKTPGWLSYYKGYLKGYFKGFGNRDKRNEVINGENKI